jgi:hypothetical protein
MSRMMTLHLDPKDATLAAAREKLGLANGELDSSFGVVRIRPKDHLYAVMVDDEVGDKLSGAEGVSGPYSNPGISTFELKQEE